MPQESRTPQEPNSTPAVTPAEPAADKGVRITVKFASHQAHRRAERELGKPISRYSGFQRSGKGLSDLPEEDALKLIGIVSGVTRHNPKRSKF